MPRFEMDVKMVVDAEDKHAASEWAKVLIDTQGDDQIRVKKRQVKVRELKP